MAKRKRRDEAVSIDFKSSNAEAYDRISKHRSCWIHVVACLYARRIKISKQEAGKLWDFESTCPCYSGTFPCRQRSKRRTRPKTTITKAIKEKKRLDSGAFDCYFENLWKSFSEDKRSSFTYFDCLWFYQYMKSSSKAHILAWIKRKQIFSKKYVIVSIVYCTHWSLLIFCNLGESLESEVRTPCMLLLDSLEMANPRRLEPDIRKFVLDIYRSEGKAENEGLIFKIPFLVPKVPQQRNGEECGNYVLFFINLFVQGAPDNFSIEGYPYFMKQNWFSPDCIERFLEGLESFQKQLP